MMLTQPYGLTHLLSKKIFFSQGVRIIIFYNLQVKLNDFTYWLYDFMTSILYTENYFVMDT